VKHHHCHHVRWVKNCISILIESHLAIRASQLTPGYSQYKSRFYHSWTDHLPVTKGPSLRHNREILPPMHARIDPSPAQRMSRSGCSLPLSHGGFNWSLQHLAAVLSAGVSYPKVFLRRWFSFRATLFNSACEYTDRSAPLGKYWRSSRFVFSFVPRCHGLRGSQK